MTLDYACNYLIVKYDEVEKSRKRLMIVIPAKAGIQFFQRLRNSLDTGFHR